MAVGAHEGCANGTVLPDDVFERLRAVADAVLYEGYLLYPYRRSSAKNRVRWQFGVLAPREWAEHDGPVAEGLSGAVDAWYQQTECLVRAVPGAVLRVRVRYLHLQRKQVEELLPDGAHRQVESLADGDDVHLAFDEAVPREVEATVALDRLLTGDLCLPAGSAPGEEHESVAGGAGRVVRRREQVDAVTTVRAEPLRDGPPGAPALHRLRVRTENTGPARCGATAPRGEALAHALMATHTLIGGEGVEFVSLTDPPDDCEEHARACRNVHTFPVLGGEPGCGEVVLSSPILLPDHPQVAPESPGDLHDAAEIDEILTLRTLLLTDEEKREARATDRRAADILDRVESMPPEIFARLHGAIRSLEPAAQPPGRPAPQPLGRPAAQPLAQPAAQPLGRPAARAPAWSAAHGPGGPFPEAADSASPGPAAGVPWWGDGADDGLSPTTDTVLVDGVPVAAGSAVRLRPAARGADAQDMFLDGRTARVAAVLHDVDGSMHVAVTLDDDPAAELNGWYGRFHYFRPNELVPLTPTHDGGRDGRP
ncbi:hypothetical protein [Streptomyces actuosus]|uniref:hypothetical protein n=1 Tax=Streptomyces actuosus TaxID=1885 RepID=UPI001F055782|nr:hypothetical protein [Streptomyces actuosus]